MTRRGRSKLDPTLPMPTAWNRRDGRRDHRAFQIHVRTPAEGRPAPRIVPEAEKSWRPRDFHF